MSKCRCELLDGSDLDSLRRLAERMQISTYSTAFSGVDSPGTAMAMLRAILGQILDRNIYAPEHLHAVVPWLHVARNIRAQRVACTMMLAHASQEWVPHAQQEILAHPHPPTCLFADIASFLKPGIREVLGDLQKKDLLTCCLQTLVMDDKAVLSCLAGSNLFTIYERWAPCLVQVILASRLPELRHAFCQCHNAQCQIVPNVANIHIAGTPCTAASTMGLRDNELALSFGHFLTWIAQRRLCQEPILVQENVGEFDRNHLITLLPMYDWTFAIVSPCQVGWPVRRARQWCVWLCCKLVAMTVLAWVLLGVSISR